MRLNRSTWILIGCTGTTLALFCAGCIFLGLILIIFSSSGTATTQASRNRQQPTERAYRVGQDVTVSEVRWRVLEAEDLGNRLEPPNEYQEPLTTPGRFIRVRFEVENLSSNQNSYGGVELIDRRERRFENSSDAFPWVEDNKTCIIETLNPNIPKTCTDIFEVPTDATNLKLVVGDLNVFSSKEAQIDLGIQ